MTVSAATAQSPSTVAALLAKIKAEQAQTQSPAKTQTLQSLGAQIVRTLEASFQASGSSADGDSSDPLASLLAQADGDSGTDSSTGTPSAADLSALLAKTKPGPAGDQARAAILATLTSGQSGLTPTSTRSTSSNLFDFLG